MIVIADLVQGQSCVKGDIEYSIATYSDELFVDKKYGRFLDSLLKQPVLEYFRDNDIRNLPTEDNDKDKNKDLSPSERHVIEPLFIDMSTFNGIYAKRIWELDPKARRATRFGCGYHHQLFILKDNAYVKLSNDSLRNEKLIGTLFTTEFSANEVSRMIGYFKYGVICDAYTYLPSFFIKRDDEVLFDSVIGL